MKEFLRTVALFLDFKDDEIEFLARAARERRVSEGSYILRKGDPGSSACILKEGAAETLLEKPGGPPVHLSKIGPGDVFGEIALFDGEPRSASVIAQRDSTIIEISRELFLSEIAQRPDVSLKLLAAISKRLRRSENIVSNYADRIYGDVMPRLEVAVSAQLDSAKTICEQSKERVASVTEQVENKWSILTRVASIAGVVLALAAGYGIYNLDTTRKDIKNESTNTLDEAKTELNKSVTEANDLKGEVQELVENAKKIEVKLNEDQSALNNLKEKDNRLWMGRLWMDKLRHDLRLDENGGLDVSGDLELNNVGRDFLMAQRRLLRNYFGQPDKWDSEILLEAMDLLTKIFRHQYLVLTPSDWDKVVDGIDKLLRNPPDGWRPSQRLEHSVTTLYQRMRNDKSTAEALGRLNERMFTILTDTESTRHAKRQTALILARLGKNLTSVKQVLRENLNKTEDPWQRSQATVALIALGDPAGWQRIQADLGDWRPIEDPAGHVKPHERDPDKEKALAAAIALAENARPGSWWAKPEQKENFAPQAIIKELMPNVTKQVSSLPADEANLTQLAFSLIANNIINGLNRQQGRWNVFYWRFACNLVCDLGCKPQWGKEGDRLCDECYAGLFDAFPRLEGKLNDTVGSCTLATSDTTAPR